MQRWGDATRAFDGQLRSCGSRVYPTHNFFSACMRQPPVGYKSAAARLRQAFGDACSRSADDASRLLGRDTSLMAQEIAVSDRANNAATDRRPYSGPALFVFQARASRTIGRDLVELRRLGRCSSAGARS